MNGENTELVQFRDNRYRRERNEHRFNQFRDQKETQRLHCERQALWRGVCPRRAESGALARAGMARAEMRQRARAGTGDTGDTYLKQL